MTPLRLVPLVHRAAHRIGLYLADQQGDALSQGESHILALLAGSNPMTIRQLHEGLAHMRATLTSILDRLVARGLVTREVGESDRRTFVVSLTKRGRRVAKRVFQNLHELERAVSTRVSETDIAAFSRVLAAIEDEAHSRATADPSRESRRRRRPGPTL